MKTTYKQASIHYTKSGDGDAVLLLHGFLENASMWDFFIENFKNSHTLIAPDLLGHGLSEGLGYVHTTEEMATQVKSIIDIEKIEKITLVGHSMGGYVALALAEKFPKMIQKLILLNSTPKADSKVRKQNRDRAVSLVKKNKNAFVSMSISNLFAEKNRIQFTVEIENLKTEALTMSAKNIAAALEGMKIRKGRSYTLKKITIPKYIIAGTEDPVIPLKEIRVVAEKTETPLIVMEGGHMTSIENREELLAFFREIL